MKFNVGCLSFHFSFSLVSKELVPQGKTVCVLASGKKEILAS